MAAWLLCGSVCAVRLMCFCGPIFCVLPNHGCPLALSIRADSFSAVFLLFWTVIDGGVSHSLALWAGATDDVG
jgi:hypothetical protein